MIKFFFKMLCYIYLQQMGKLADPNLCTKFHHEFSFAYLVNVATLFLSFHFSPIE